MPPKIIGQTPESIIILNDDGSQLEIPVNAGVNVGDIPMPVQQELPSIPTIDELTQPPLDQAYTLPGFEQTLAPTQLEPTPQVQPSLPNLQGAGVSTSGFSGDKFAQVKEAIPLSSDTNQPLGIDTQPTEVQKRSAAFTQGAQQQAEGIQQLAEAESQADLALAGAKENEAQVIQDQARQQTEANLRFQEGVQAKLAQFQRASAEVAALEAKGIDRSRLWNSKSRGEKFLIGLGAFIDGFLKPKTGGTGTIQIILDTVDKDVDEQIANLSLARNKLGDIKSELGLLLDVNQSDAALRAQLSTLLLEGAARQTEAEVARSKSPVRQAKAMELLGQIQQALAQKYEEVTQTLFGEAVKDEQLRQGRQALAIDRGRLALSREQLNLQRDKMLADMLKVPDQKTIVNPLNGQVIGTVRSTFADDKEQIRKVQNQVVAYTQLRDQYSRYRQAVEEAGRVIKNNPLPDTELAKLNAMHADLLDLMARARTGAQITDAEQARLQKIVPSPQGLFTRAEPAKVLDERILTEDRNIRAEILGSVDITNADQLPFFSFQAKDRAGEPGKTNLDNELNAITQLSKQIKDGPVSPDVELELEQRAQGLISLYKENPADLYAIQIVASKIPPKYRKIVSSDPRVGSVDLIKYFRDEEKKRLSDTTEGDIVEDRQTRATGGLNPFMVP